MNNKKGDNKCFDYSIALCMHSHEMETNFNRTNKIKTYLNNFNFESINYPLKKKVMKHLKIIMKQLL